MISSAIDKILAEVCWEKAVLRARRLYPDANGMSRRTRLGATFLAVQGARELYEKASSELASRLIWMVLGDDPGSKFSLTPNTSDKPYLVQDTSGGMCMACIDEDMDKAMIAQYAALGVELRIINE